MVTAAGGDAAGGDAAGGDAACGDAAGSDAAKASGVCARRNSFELVRTVRRQVRGERGTLTSRCCNIVTSTT